MSITSAGPFNPQLPLVTTANGVVTSDQAAWFLRLSAQLQSMTQAVNTNFGTNLFPLSNQPALGSGDAGYVAFVTDYGHLVYWDGAAWQWLDGDRPLRFSDFGAAPGVGWGLCDGSAYNYLVVGGATLTSASFTTPNLSGSPAYRKSGASYTGTITAANAPGFSGVSSPQSTTLSGSTDNENATQSVQAGAGATVPASPHIHGTSAIVVVSHTHGAGTFAVDATGQPAHLAVLPYVRL